MEFQQIQKGQTMSREDMRGMTEELYDYILTHPIDKRVKRKFQQVLQKIDQKAREEERAIFQEKLDKQANIAIEMAGDSRKLAKSYREAIQEERKKILNRVYTLLLSSCPSLSMAKDAFDEFKADLLKGE